MAQYETTTLTSNLSHAGLLFLVCGAIIAIVSGPLYATAIQDEENYDKTTCLVEYTTFYVETCDWCDDSVCYDECNPDGDGGQTCRTTCPCVWRVYTCYKAIWVVDYHTEPVKYCNSKETDIALIEGKIFHKSSGSNASERSRRAAQKELDKHPNGGTGSCYINSLNCYEGKWTLADSKKLLIALISGGAIAGFGLLLLGIGELIYIRLDLIIYKCYIGLMCPTSVDTSVNTTSTSTNSIFPSAPIELTES